MCHWILIRVDVYVVKQAKLIILILPGIVPAGRVYQNVEETQAGCCLTVPLPVDSVISVKISITIALIGLDRVNATKTNNTWIFTAKR